MLKVYFVDDDELIIEELKQMINWSEYGYEICGYSNNSLEAINEIIKLKPSLVISDVQMDTMNGLELVEKIRQIDPKIFFCFLSCYDKFDYAIEAIRLGAIRYMKKPLRISDLKSLLYEIRDKKVEKFSHKLSNILVNSEANQDLLIKELFEGSSLMMNNESYRIVAFFGALQEKIYLKGVSKSSVILYIDDKMQIDIAFGLDVEKLKEKMKDKPCSVGISEEKNNFDDVASLIRQARIASKSKFITGQETFTVYKDIELVSNIVETIKNIRKEYELKNYIFELKNLIIENNIPANYIQNIYRVIIYSMIRLNVIEYDEELINLSVLNFYNNIDKMFEDLLSNFEEITEDYYNSLLMNEIKEDLESNLCNKLSLSEYAQKYGYNTSYFSQWFKKKFGVAFAEYVIKAKIERAKELMYLRRDYSLRKIAFEVGYDDYYHFSKIFKKYTGVSPLDFYNNIVKE